MNSTWSSIFRLQAVAAGLLFWTLGSGSAAARDKTGSRDLELRLRLDTGAGWDDNVYWSLGDDPAHLPPGQATDVPPEVSDGMVTERPLIQFAIWPAWRHLVELSWKADLRHYFRQGFAQFHRPTVRYGYRLWRQLFLRVGAAGELFWRQKFNAERFYGAEGRLGVGWLHPLTWRASVDYVAGYRLYPDPDRETDGVKQQDQGHGVNIRGSVRLHRMVSLGVGYLYMWGDSNKDFHDRESHRWEGAVALSFPWKLEAVIGAGGEAHLMDRYHELGGGTPGHRRDLLFFVGARVTYRPLAWLGVWVSYVFSHLNIDFQDQGRSTHRQVVMAGVGFQWHKRWTKKPSTALVVRPARWSPPDLKTKPAARSGKGRWVTFRLRADRARKVSVIGTFNRWSAPQGRMRRKGRFWVGTFFLPSGRHTYTFEVDGSTLNRPPGAFAYVSDGFGGMNGVVVVK